MSSRISPAQDRSLSDLLSGLRLSRGAWAYADLREGAGFAVAPADAVHVHAMIHGTARMAFASGEQAEILAGDIVLLPSGEAHALRTTPQAVTVPHEGLKAAANTDIPQDHCFGESRAGPGTRVVARVLSGRMAATWPEGVTRASLPALLQANANGISRLFTPDALALAGVGPGASALLTRMAETLLVAAFRTDHRYRSLLSPPDRDPVRDALARIAADPSADWTVESLARAVGMGRSSFAALFAQTVGKAPMEVVAEHRMERAAALLRESRLKVAEIGELSGYGSEAAFSRRFTRHFGITPSKMRDAARAERATEHAMQQPAPAFRPLLGGERSPRS